MISPFKLLKSRRNLSGLLSNYLYFCDANSRGFWGGLSSAEEDALVGLVRDCAHKDDPIVEFGTLFGWSTLLMASAKPQEQPLLTVDNFSWNPFMIPRADHEKFARRCLKLAESHFGVRLVASESRDFKASWSGGRPALVFIDAAHDYTSVLEDIAWARSVGARVICGHDYSEMWPGVQRAVDESFSGEFSCTDSLWWWKSLA